MEIKVSTCPWEIVEELLLYRVAQLSKFSEELAKVVGWIDLENCKAVNTRTFECGLNDLGHEDLVTNGDISPEIEKLIEAVYDIVNTFSQLLLCGKELNISVNDLYLKKELNEELGALACYFSTELTNSLSSQDGSISAKLFVWYLLRQKWLAEESERPHDAKVLSKFIDKILAYGIDKNQWKIKS